MQLDWKVFCTIGLVWMEIIRNLFIVRFECLSVELMVIDLNLYSSSDV